MNDDLAAGINKTISVSGEDPTNADVVGGALSAGKPAVPWAVFRQQEGGAPPGRDQIFARSFAGGAWTTRGAGTVGGRSSASPQFTGSLNFDQGREGEAPAIDFAGAGRTVPWATWYENTIGEGFDHDNVFASRFDNTGDANQGKWIFGGQSRGTGGGSVPVPSLNIHTNQDAENPSVAGGSAVDPTKPGPWVTWQETTESPVDGADQIFVVAADRPRRRELRRRDAGRRRTSKAMCRRSAASASSRRGSGVSAPAAPTRASTSTRRATGSSPTSRSPALPTASRGSSGTRKAKARSDSTKTRWCSRPRASRTKRPMAAFTGKPSAIRPATMLARAANGFGRVCRIDENEGECSLNKDPKKDAEDPRVAAGTMNPAKATAPWVAWDEDVAGVKQVFVSRFVATPSPHFEIVNGGAPISTGSGDSTRPDITFSANTPYVSWREDVGGGFVKAFTGHFVNPANPTFVLDESDVPLTPDRPGGRT